MRKTLPLTSAVAALSLSLAGCNSDSQDAVTVSQSYGPSPVLPEPQHAKVPTVNVAAAVGWLSDGKPNAADGMAVNAFTTAEADRVDVLEVDRATGKTRIFASGLRNPNGLSWQPQGGALWVAVNERDELGNDLVPDYMTSLKDGGFYGWPYSYFGQHVDDRVPPQRSDLVAKAIAPDSALGAHTASLGLTFNTGHLFPPDMEGGAFISQHGSWNRKPRAGYRVIFVPFTDGKPSGPPRDILTGFLNDSGEAQGRPVGVRIDRSGALLVGDDVGNTIWRVTPSATRSASQ